MLKINKNGLRYKRVISGNVNVTGKGFGSPPPRYLVSWGYESASFIVDSQDFERLQNLQKEVEALKVSGIGKGQFFQKGKKVLIKIMELGKNLFSTMVENVKKIVNNSNQKGNVNNTVNTQIQEHVNNTNRCGRHLLASPRQGDPVNNTPKNQENDDPPENEEEVENTDNNPPKTWKHIEITCLKQLIGERYSFKLIKEYLIKYSINEIKMQAEKLGLKRSKAKRSKAWEEHDLKVLFDGLKISLPLKSIQEQLFSYRTIRSLEKKACQLGLKTCQTQAFQGASTLKKVTKSSSPPKGGIVLPWSQEELDHVQKGLKEGLTHQEIVDKYLQSPKRSVSSLGYLIKKKKWKSAKPWTLDELFQLDLGLHKNSSLDEIQKQFLPHRALKELEARIQIPNWNNSLYHWHSPLNVDDIQLAFLAGFILADGSFTMSYNIDIGISKKDQHILMWVCDVFQLPHSKIKQKLKTQSVRLNLNSSLGRFLIKNFQLSPQKSKGQVVFPSFLNELCLKAYLIGLFYGDGCHSKSRGRSRVDFVSSYGFLEELLNYIQKNDIATHFTENNIKRIPTKTPGYDLAILRLHGKDAIRLFEFLAKPEIMQQLPNLDRKLQDILTCDLPREKKR